MLTKEQVKILKGLGIFMMITLHLFGFPMWLKNGNAYIPIFKNFNFEFIIAKFCGIVVGFYLFLSGYGLERKYRIVNCNYKEILKKIWEIYKEYFIIFIPFTLIGYLFYDLRFKNMKDFIFNITAIKPTLNVFVWFIRLYVQYLLIFPILKRILDKNRIISYSIPIFIYLCTILNTVFFYFFPQLKWFRETFYYELIYSFGSYLLLFCLGYLFSKDEIYKKVFKKLNRKIGLKYFGLIGILLIIVCREYARTLFGKIILFDVFMVDQILVPCFIFFSIIYLNKTRFLKQLFFKLSKYSTGIWLMHCYFILSYFQKIIYFPKLSILILVWSFLIFISISEIIFKVRRSILSEGKILIIKWKD